MRDVCLLIELPEEILALILFDLNRTDLLAAALTCKKLSQVASQEQIAYSYIRADLTRYGLWRHLAENPSLARHVRHLEICHEVDDEIIRHSRAVQRVMADGEEGVEGGSLWERCFRDVEKLEQVIGCFLAAIGHMRNLKTFHWLLCGIVPEVFMAVAKASARLEELVFFDTGSDHKGNELDYHSLITPFQGLKRFWYRNPPNTSAQISPDRSSALHELLHVRCPSLKDLHLDFGSEEDYQDETLPELFRAAHWPSLERLSVSADVFQEHFEEFLAVHSSLRSLRISELHPIDEILKALPSQGLCRIELDTSTSLALDEAVARLLTGPGVDSIEEFSFLQEGGYHWHISPEGVITESELTHRFLCDFFFLATFPHLRQLIIRSATHSQSSLVTLLGVVPLSLEILVYYPLQSKIYYAEKETDDWETDISVLFRPIARLPKLTHLGILKTNVWEGHDDIGMEHLEKLLEPLFRASPSLQYVAAAPPLGSEIFWCQVETETNGARSACKAVNRGGCGRVPMDIRNFWGGFTDIRALQHRYHSGFGKYWPK